MRYSIPEFRLEKFVVANEIQYIKDAGVEIRTELEFSKDITIESLRDEGYKAILVGIGTQLNRKLSVPGEDLEGVTYGLEFLRAVTLGLYANVGERVAVIGGGNSAVDAARTAKRLGAKDVLILYRRTQNEMPALPHEVKAAEREGIRFHFLVAPKRIVGENGKVRAIECLRMRLGEPDASGRRQPIPISFSEHQYEVDLVIPAIGQIPEKSCIPNELLDEKMKGDLVPVDSITMETKMPGVFAGGDIVTGPSSIIQAIGAGKQAAVSIHRYLTGLDLKAGREEIEETTWVKDWKSLKKKPLRYEAPEEKPSLSFEEMERFVEETRRKAMFEAFRCLGCGPCSECLEKTDLCKGDKAVVNENLCTGCNTCTLVCTFDAIKKNENGVAQVNEEVCRGCGVCAAQCPERAITMQHSTDEQILTCALAPLER